MNYIFDFDGTLVDSLEAFVAVFNKHMRPSDNPLTPTEITSLRKMSSRRALRSLKIRWWHLPKLIFRGMPDYKALLPELDTFKGLPEVIKKLHDRGDKLFIITTNTHDNVSRFLRKHKIDQYFSGMDTAVGVFSKTSHIRNMTRVYKLKKKETVYVGDETRDMQAGKYARVKVVAVSWGFNDTSILKKYNPARIVHKPEDLLKINL